MRKFFLPVAFFILTPTILFLSLALLVSHMHKNVLGVSTFQKPDFAYAGLPTENNVFAASATLIDKRPIVLSNYLSSYHSPLTPYAPLLVTKADEYNIDYRLLVGIAMQESELCHHPSKKDIYNCWGFGIWGKHSTGFSSYQEAIDIISHYFANKKEKGIDSLDAIGRIYNPNNTNNWTQNVALVMSEL